MRINHLTSGILNLSWRRKKGKREMLNLGGFPVDKLLISSRKKKARESLKCLFDNEGRNEKRKRAFRCQQGLFGAL